MITKQLIRSALRAIANRDGYVISGNHVFRCDDYQAIARGHWRKSVSEAPERHSDRMVRAAGLLARTYDRCLSANGVLLP